MASFRAGKNSRARVDGDNLALDNWACRETGDYLKTDNFESNGFRTGLIGFKGLDADISGSWDANDNPLDDPPGLFVRDDGETANLYTNVTDNKFYDFAGGWVCPNSDVSTTADGLVLFKSTIKSDANYTLPHGSV